MSGELVFEIGSEELPAGEVLVALESLRSSIVGGLDEARLAHGEAQTYATPRRLTVVVPDVQSRQEDLTKEVSGPPVKVAFVDGKPTKAAEGFARGLGLTVDDLERRDTKKGEYLFAVVQEEGRSAADLLAELLSDAIGKIPFKRTMRWGEGQSTFVRPILWIVALLDGEVLKVEYAGVESGHRSRGHRFLAPDLFEVTSGAQYVEELEQRHVVVDVARRRERLLEGATQLAESAGGRLRDDDALIDEVTQLVEKPVPLLCEFDEKYLEIPHQVLISEMREHQRYLPVVDGSGKLLPYFIVISNTLVNDEQIVKDGYRRVLTARFADGVFFFEEDRKTPLAERIDALKDVRFHRALGSIYEKVERIVDLAYGVAQALGEAVARPDDPRALAAQPASEDLGWAIARAGFLMKVDLVSNMVYEFPELQGVMGRAYAALGGEPAPIAVAIEEHYLPRHASDELPAEALGAYLGIADRLDTITGIFATGKGPTGAADPFGLRRAALGIIRILIERGWHLSLGGLIDQAVDRLGERRKKPEGEIGADVRAFFRGRLRGVLIGEGIPVDVVEAVLEAGHDDLVDAVARARALEALRCGPDFEPISVAFKRVANILKGQTPGEVDPTLLDEPEQALRAATETTAARVADLCSAREFEGAFGATGELRPAVDAFFDAVMVMDEDVAVRARRVALLGRVHAIFAPLADFTRLQ